MSKLVDKHVTLLAEDHAKLKQLADLQKRSMRNTVAILIDNELKRLEIKENK